MEGGFKHVLTERNTRAERRHDIAMEKLDQQLWLQHRQNLSDNSLPRAMSCTSTASKECCPCHAQIPVHHKIIPYPPRPTFNISNTDP
jgi:hypothetical protein